ncbi:MAG: peptidoglycan DD-metalloendopeptidase family protein [Vicinamibacterales bacterium]
MTERIVITALAVLAQALVQATGPIEISARARSLRPGEVVVLTIAGPGVSDAVRVRAFDRDVATYRDGDTWRAIVGVDLDVKPGNYRVTAESGAAANGARGTHVLRIVSRTFRTRRLTVDEAFVTPPASEQPRIERESALLAATWRSSATGRLWTTPFMRPVPQAANSAFGSRSIFNGKPRTAHGGADFLSPAGTPIRAPNAGRIAVARKLYFSGNTVIIDHGLGVFSTLAHLSTIDVREGELVTPGQRIGLVGATGRVTGPHLHWAVRAGDARVDPLSLLAVLGPPASAP